jgi:hypothetical protein
MLSSNPLRPRTQDRQEEILPIINHNYSNNGSTDGQRNSVMKMFQVGVDNPQFFN